MAVTQPFAPNLSSAYQNIQDALHTRTEIAAEDTGAMGMGAAIAAPLGQETQDRREALFKATLEDHLNQNKVGYAAQAEGKTLTTPEDYNDLATSMNFDPETIKGVIPKQGVWQTPAEKLGIASQLKRTDTIEKMASAKETSGDTTGANLMRLFARSSGPEADQLIARLNGIAQVESYIDPVTGEMKYRDKMTKMPLQVPGVSLAQPTPGGVNDLPSLRAVDKRQAAALEAASKSAASDTALKPTAKDLEDLEQLKKLLNSKNPSATINIRADLARDIGGVPGGRFSSILASTEGTDPSISARIGNYMSMKTTGQMSDKIKNELLDQIDTTVTNRKGQLAAALNEKHSQLKAQAPYASDDLIANQLGYQRYLTSKKPAETSSSLDIHDPKVQKAAVDFLTQNGKTVNAKNVKILISDPAKYGFKVQ